MSKLNIKFLVLLSALMSCTPSLGAMKSTGSTANAIVGRNQVDRLPVSPDLHIEKINTFGTPELDLEAFLSIFNSRSLSFKEDWEIKYNFGFSREGCFSISKTPWNSDSVYRLIWNIPLKIIGDFRHPDDSTVEFDVMHGDGKTYTVIGKRVVEEFFLSKPYSVKCIFYIKDQDSIVNKKFERMANLEVKNHEDIESRESAIKRMYIPLVLRLLTRGASVNKMKKMLKDGRFLFATYSKLYDNAPFFTHYILGAEKRNSEGLSVKLLDDNNFEYVYDKLSQASDGFWNFELVRTIEPSKRVKLW